jgi:hypothetical protein
MPQKRQNSQFRFWAAAVMTAMTEIEAQSRHNTTDGSRAGATTRLEAVKWVASGSSYERLTSAHERL